jgi:hypothetical protein
MKALFVLLSFIGFAAKEPASNPQVKQSASISPNYWVVKVTCCPWRIIIKDEKLASKENVLNVKSGRVEGEKLTLNIDPGNLSAEEIEGLKTAKLAGPIKPVIIRPSQLKEMNIEGADKDITLVENSAMANVGQKANANGTADRKKGEPTITITFTIKFGK